MRRYFLAGAESMVGSDCSGVEPWVARFLPDFTLRERFELEDLLRSGMHVMRTHIAQSWTDVIRGGT